MQIKYLNTIPITELGTLQIPPAAMELIPQAGDIGNDWGKLVRNRHESVEPGKDEDHIYAIQFSLCIISSETSQTELNRAVLAVFKASFCKENILSVMVQIKEESFVYHILAYPLVGRVLRPLYWCDKTENGELLVNDDFYNKLAFHLEQTFKIKLEKREVSDACLEKQKSSGPKIDRITEMIFTPQKIDDKQELIFDTEGFNKQLMIDMAYEKFKEISIHSIAYFTTGVEKGLYFQAQRGDLSPQGFMDHVAQFLSRTYPYLSENDKGLLMDKVFSAVYKNYVLDSLIDADDISDIKVLDPKHIRVKANGKRMTSNVAFIDAKDYLRYINSLAMRYGLNLANEAFHVFTDTRTSDKFIMRFNISTPYVNSSPFPYLHIRKIRKDKYSIEDLIRIQCMPRKIAEYLRYKINTSSMIFCGQGGSGKTTMINCLIEEISYTKSGLVIQESEELFSSHHPDFMFQHITRSKNGMPAYDLKDEARNGLLTDLDYFIIGEIKGGEALYFLNAASTGHKCVCTVHSPSTKDAIDKLADYVMYESSYTKEQAVYMLKEMKTIVYMENFKIKEISEIVGWDEERNQLIFKLMYQL